MTILPIPPERPGLYGIHNSNRGVDQLWGKNQFNSTFPAALACFMRDSAIHPIYLTVDADLRVAVSEISVAELFNTDKPNSELRFDFEAKFEPYQDYALDDIGGIDLVVKHQAQNSGTEWRRPLEVKLTVVPDSATCNLPESEWGGELVIRPASTKYCALGIRHSLSADLNKAREIFQEVCGRIEHWDSSHEIDAKKGAILGTLDEFQRHFRYLQKPFLMQPIWRTEGKTPLLSNQAFDIFVWSDFALCRTFLDRSLASPDGAVNRYMRSSSRLARVLYELSSRERSNINSIYTEMGFRLQTDKEFALNGGVTREYMRCSRLMSPALSKEVVPQIIGLGGEQKLSPERRLDATIYYSIRRN